jgi:type II secretory pathway pseudopilin PulG
VTLVNQIFHMRRGITLLEVLISLGILAVGLTSVLSLIPAGRSFAARGASADQAANMSENAFADAITFGLTKIDSLTSIAGGPAPSSPIMIDPASAASSGTWAAWSMGTIQTAYLKTAGTFTGTAAASIAPRTGVAGSYFQESRDGVIYASPQTEDDFPANEFLGGVRAFDGRNSWIAMLTKAASGAFAPGDQATLTIITFSGRESGLIPSASSMTSTVFVTSPIESLTWTAGATLVPGRENKDVVRPGAYFLLPTSPPSVRRVVMADLNTTNDGAAVQFNGPPIPAGLAGQQFYLIPDATSATEYSVTIEGKSDFTR